MTYDNWKTRSPDDERDRFYGAGHDDERDDHEPPPVAELLHKLRQAPQPDDAEPRRIERVLVSIPPALMPPSPTATASTESVLAHLEDVAEQAIMAQCAVIRELVKEAQSLDNMLVADLARIRDTLRVGISTGARAAKLAQDIRNAMGEMRANHDDVKTPT